MRLLLDEHISPDVADALQAEGFDVEAVDGSPLDGLDDRPLWEAAIAEGRVLVTYNRADFQELYEEFWSAGIAHPGLVLVSESTIRPGDLGTLLRSLRRLLAEDPDLTNRWDWLSRA